MNDIIELIKIENYYTSILISKNGYTNITWSNC